MKDDLCPLCGQRMLMRHGVLLSPKQADIFDLIENSGHRGILGEVLRYVFYPDKPRKLAQTCVSSTIHQINAVLAETPVHIVMPGKNGNGVYWVSHR